MKSAYNRVNLSHLYDTIEKKRILTPEKLALLKFIHKNLDIKLGFSSCKPTNGVPQGLTTSPACFNIYIEELLEQLKHAGIPAFAYADDLVFTAGNIAEV
jgi:hypothetical protein